MDSFPLDPRIAITVSSHSIMSGLEIISFSKGLNILQISFNFSFYILRIAIANHYHTFIKP